jgi:hypothetical protein
LKLFRGILKSYIEIPPGLRFRSFGTEHGPVVGGNTFTGLLRRRRRSFGTEHGPVVRNTFTAISQHTLHPALLRSLGGRNDDTLWDREDACRELGPRKGDTRSRLLVHAPFDILRVFHGKSIAWR